MNAHPNQPGSCTDRIANDRRIVLTLDAGGSSFRFAAAQGGRIIADLPPVPAETADLGRCLAELAAGFKAVRDRCETAPCAVSFAFPGPADYPRGVIGDLPNLPCFRGGVALGPYLADCLGLPVFINNDGNLFALGEAVGGFLPRLNAAFGRAAVPRRFGSLFGVTLGTGFGGGYVFEGRIVNGENSSAGEVWLLRNVLHGETAAEEGASIRAVRREFACAIGTEVNAVPAPREIADIARDPGHPQAVAARGAFASLGTVTGDALAQVCTIVDAPVVIGGGIAAAADLFMPALMAAMRASFSFTGGDRRRLSARPFWFDREEELRPVLQRGGRQIVVPISDRKVAYDSEPCLPVGISQLGATEAIVLGAYAEALRHLDNPA